MKTISRDACRYTALFCEENIWWLARSLVDAGMAAARLKVLLFSNPWQSIVLLNQRQADAGEPLCWDYHVVLQVDRDHEAWIFDLDTRLPFPVPCATYLSRTFPPSPALPERYRTQVRIIPAASYLAHFYSDRGHMIGRIPAEAFPDYPIIQPPAGVARISLGEYRDLHKTLGDGSVVVSLDALRSRQTGRPGEAPGADPSAAQ